MSRRKQKKGFSCITETKVLHANRHYIGEYITPVRMSFLLEGATDSTRKLGLFKSVQVNKKKKTFSAIIETKRQARKRIGSVRPTRVVPNKKRKMERDLKNLAHWLDND